MQSLRPQGSFSQTPSDPHPPFAPPPNATTHFATAFFSCCYSALGVGTYLERATTGIGIGAFWGMGYAASKVFDDYKKGQIQSKRDALWDLGIYASASAMNVMVSNGSALMVHYGLEKNLDNFPTALMISTSFFMGTVLGTVTGVALEQFLRRIENSQDP